DDEKWWVSYSFYDSAGVFIGETKLPVDQTTASSSGWLADTNGVGATVLPKDSWKTIIKFVGGKNATGTVWADDFIFTGRGDWAGQDWNAGVGVPTGWYYWLPPNGGNDGLLANGFENTVLTTEAAHSGLNSLKFDLPFDRQPHDGFVGTKRFLLNGTGIGTIAQLNPEGLGGISMPSTVNPGDLLRATVWIKASNLVPDSAAAYPATWSVGLTPLFDKGNGNNLGYNPTGPDLMFTFPAVTSFEWTSYSADFTVPNDPSYKVMEVRLHIYARFTGTVYFDDLTVQKMGTSTGVGGDTKIPATYMLLENYPNPFNPTTTIQYALPQTANVSLSIYNVLGQHVRTLVEGTVTTGYHNATWDGRNDQGQTVHSGVYFYRLTTGQSSFVKKMLLMK
ncbi:MAG TPA: T9SS type A sorting domain-containing protein, partial [Bacteroidota bacterium]|nr:T9SS type A sorting domain-containing protein [Bacteroidota bacterium]